jgi:hypothetical protein
MDILDSISQSWSEFAHWVGLEEGKNPSTESSPKETPHRDPVCAPSLEDQKLGQEYQKEAARLKELAANYEMNGDVVQARRFSIKADAYTSFAKYRLDTEHLMCNPNYNKEVTENILRIIAQPPANGNQDPWIVQRLKATLPYMLWKKHFKEAS